jgi:hypothetical protein
LQEKPGTFQLRTVVRKLLKRDQLVAGIGVRIKTEPLVKIRRSVIAPSLPLSRVIGQRKRKADVAFGHR